MSRFANSVGLLPTVVMATILLGGSAFAQAESEGRMAPSARVTGGIGEEFCAEAFTYENNQFFPPDSTSADNPPAASADLTKNCRGPVVVTFSAEVRAPNSGDFIHISVRSTCIDDVFPGGCTPGAQKLAVPGETFFEWGPSANLHASSITMVFPQIGKGHHRYEVLAAGDGDSYLWFRSMTVRALQK